LKRCQSRQARGPSIPVERLVVVSKMHFVNIFTGKLLLAKERRGAPQSSRDVAYWLIVLQKSFWGDERNFLELLMRFTRGDVRDHIDSSKIDHGPS